MSSVLVPLMHNGAKYSYTTQAVAPIKVLKVLAALPELVTISIEPDALTGKFTNSVLSRHSMP